MENYFAINQRDSLKINGHTILGSPCMMVQNETQLKTYISNLIESGNGGYSVAINALKIYRYKLIKEFRPTVDYSNLTTPDGFGAQLGFRLLYRKKILKVDLPGLILDFANENGYSIFLLGTSEENNALAAQKIRQKYPNIQISGRYHGYFKDKRLVKKLIHQTSPDIVLIAMGSPKQEYLGAELYHELNSSLYIGVGGRLDILAGKAKRAPQIYQKFGLEWFYRIVLDPKRYKQIFQLTHFLLLLIFESVKSYFSKFAIR